MKLWSVICCIYNSYPVARQCLNALLDTPPFRKADDDACEIVLVDNHGPDPDAAVYARACVATSPNVRVVDPGANLGCHGGWNFGYKHTTGRYVVKLDDDTIMLTDAWAEKMSRALDVFGELAFVAADINESAKQKNPVEMRQREDVEIELALAGIVGFSCVMFRRRDIERWGPMRTGEYRCAGDRKITEDRLYGGEEVHLARMARAEGKVMAHLPAVKVHHLDNEERHPDYAFWKRAYGYYGWTNSEMMQWLREQAGEQYARALWLEFNARTPNEVLLRDWARRLMVLGQPGAGPILQAVAAATKNGVVREACLMAAARIAERAGQ